MSAPDDAPVRTTPTVYEWLGGAPALERLFLTFYERVPSDAMLAPVFAEMPPEHARRVAAFVGEVLGGPKAYSAARGGHATMIGRHVGRALTEAQRARWMQLLLACADEVGLPADPEFRSAFVAYLEWGTRLAVINSAPGANVNGEQPMPAWGWGEAKGPYTGG
jgi:hemoglobin